MASLNNLSIGCILIGVIALMCIAHGVDYLVIKSRERKAKNAH